LVEIKPFKGIRYNKEKIKDFSLVITPPYDVIDEKEKQEFYKLSEYNMARLLLGSADNDYAEVALKFKEWQENNILKKDDQDSIYIYSQTFNHNGASFTRIGFISLVKLEELGKGILPHEKTLEKPFKDRLSLLEATKANFGCVFILYDDKQKIIDTIIKDTTSNKEPDMAFEDKYNIGHKLWKINEKDFINKLKDEMTKYQCIIADGHHRYKSVLRFKEDHPDMEEAKYTICCFINSFNEGLFVLPIDRFIFNLENVDIEKILTQLKEHFEVEEFDDVNKLIEKIDNTEILIDKEQNLKNNVFGMYCYLNKKSYFLKLKNAAVLNDHYSDKSDVYRKLDVNILHKMVFGDILGISKEDQFKGKNIEYTKGNKRALDKLQDDKYQLAFFTKAPLMREIFLTARAGEKMPQKTTYFYPKVYSGLVINRIGE